MSTTLRTFPRMSLTDAGRGANDVDMATVTNQIHSPSLADRDARHPTVAKLTVSGSFCAPAAPKETLTDRGSIPRRGHAIPHAVHNVSLRVSERRLPAGRTYRQKIGLNRPMNSRRLPLAGKSFVRGVGYKGAPSDQTHGQTPEVP